MFLINQSLEHNFNHGFCFVKILLYLGQHERTKKEMLKRSHRSTVYHDQDPICPISSGFDSIWSDFVTNLYAVFIFGSKLYMPREHPEPFSGLILPEGCTFQVISRPYRVIASDPHLISNEICDIDNHRIIMMTSFHWTTRTINEIRVHALGENSHSSVIPA
jgi:hypothetical protein